MKASLLSPAVLRRFPPGHPYLVGVSGGRDSVALVRLLLDAGYKDLRLCHLNHQLQGGSGEATAEFVKQLAKTWKLTCDIGAADVRGLAKKSRNSIEMAARDARYGFFAKIAHRRGCGTIFLAHHADDLIETLLINLFRGTGLAGLAGMREISERTMDGLALKIVRPLLAVWRREIDAFIKSARLQYRDDSTNRDLALFRNRLRLRALPYLERTLGREIRQSLWRTAQIAAEEEAILDDLLPRSTGKSRSVDLKGLRKSGVALQRRTLRQWLREQGINNVGFEVVERVRGLLDMKDGPAKTNLPGNRHARRSAGKLFIE